VQLTELVDAEPAAGRVFERILMPGIADGVGDMRIRLDAIARWLQDVAYADLLDAGFEQEGIWIVRRVRLRVEAFPRFGEPVTVRTFCSGVGRFSAERRSSVRGATGRVDAVALWVWIDANGEPARFPERFVELYGESAAGRGAPVRLRHPEPPAESERTPWSFRAADVDVAGHVNNSHYWEPLEEEFAAGEPDGIDAEIEHRDPALPGPAFVVHDGAGTWIEGADGAVHASIQRAVAS
jgi:acyl-ACP thioesterase